MKPYKNFYVKTLIRVLKNNKVYNNKTKSYLLIQFDKIYNKRNNILPTKLFSSYIYCDISIKTYYNILTEYRTLIVDKLIDDINSIIPNALIKDKKTIEKIIYNDTMNVLRMELDDTNMIVFLIKANETFYKK